MNLGELTVKFINIGQTTVKSLAIGVNKIWESIKYILFKDPVVEQICATNWGDGEHITPEQAAAVTDIGTTFQGNTEITSFDELEKFGTTSLEAKSFYQCSSLKSIDLTKIKQIGENVFNGCSSLDIDLNMPSLTKMNGLGGYFKGSGIRKIVNLGSITTIEGYFTNGGCFENCVNLEEVILPPTCVNLGKKNQTLYNSIFKGCTSLRSINLEHVEWIADECFRECKELQLELVNDKITSIGQYTFNGTKLQSINCPNVTTIGMSAFNSSALSGDISFPNLESIRGLSEFNNTSIESVSDLGKVTQIKGAAGYGMFMGCKLLKRVTFPSTLTLLGEWIVRDCPIIEAVVMKSTVPPTISTGTFTVPKACQFYVPDESVEAYKAATNWAAYADRIKPMSEYVEPTNE